MVNHVKYVDYEHLKKFNDTINQRIYKRMKYMGELELDPENRTDWNDLAPCMIGHMYVLTGNEGDTVIIDDIEYTVGDTIYATNNVHGDEDPPVAVTVNKIAASSKVITFVDNLPARTEAKDKTIYAIKNIDGSDIVGSYNVIGGTVIDMDNEKILYTDSEGTDKELAFADIMDNLDDMLDDGIFISDVRGRIVVTDDGTGTYTAEVHDEDYGGPLYSSRYYIFDGYNYVEITAAPLSYHVLDELVI